MKARAIMVAVLLLLAAVTVFAQAPAPPTGVLFGKYYLSVTKPGTGAGTVTGPGINCGVDCSEPYDSNAVVTLTATPSGSDTFVGWSGACSGTGSCVVTMSQARTATATFTAAGGGGFTTDGQEILCDRADVRFCENWETRTTACLRGSSCPGIYKSPGYDSSPTLSHTIVSTPTADGTKALSMNYPSCGPSGNCGGGFFDWQITGAPARTLFVRYYIRFASAWSWTGIDFLKVLEVDGCCPRPSNGDWFFTHFHFSSPKGAPDVAFVTDVLGGDYPQNVNGAPVVFANNQWYCFEGKTTMNTSGGASDGDVQFWINDVEKFHLANVRLVGSPPFVGGFFRWTSSGFGTNSGGSSAQSLFIDRVIVATNRIGC